MYSVISTGLRPSNVRLNKEWSVRVNKEKPGSFRRFPDTDFPLFLHELEFFDSTTETEISGRASRYLTKKSKSSRSPDSLLGQRALWEYAEISRRGLSERAAIVGNSDLRRPRFRPLL